MATRRAIHVSRRSLLAGAGAASLVGPLRSVHAQGRVAPITIVINQSPWFESFRKTVELYEKETGNKVELDVNPFAGSLEKQRNSVRAARGQYDILIMNSGWFAEMYFGGFVEALSDIDPSLKLDPEVYTLGDTVYFDPAKKTMTPAGKLMSMPISPLIPLLYYRGDLYKQAGLAVPKTFAELEENAKKLHKPPQMYGIIQRGARGPFSVTYDFFPYIFGHGGNIFRNQPNSDYTVTLNDEKGKAALDYYLRIMRDAGHPKTAAHEQAEVIQHMVTGRTAHIMMVVAAWSQMDDPSKSAVVDKVEFAVPPSLPGIKPGPGLGHWLGGVAKNMPDDRKRAAATFLRWYQTREAQIAMAKLGGIPVHAAAYRDPISKERKFRWMEPMAEALKSAVNSFHFPEASEIVAIMELGLNRAVAGEITSAQALNTMSDEIHAVMAKYNYNTGKLGPL
jgi:multiple sugar transport system substrate-binding protein